ncbi:hypothetical protein PanWU01x14_170090 [Parasponia andersonii]|uniref:Uncharacterized protein n=1 Tax=Parasponia andersonii TaxID=3476 RepID=A0A2P5CA39_PARAD|nr:hypothetical protein PanWU01x14_170090 [Parasponia andersonii]
MYCRPVLGFHCYVSLTETLLGIDGFGWCGFHHGNIKSAYQLAVQKSFRCDANVKLLAFLGYCFKFCGKNAISNTSMVLLCWKEKGPWSKYGTYSPVGG